MLRAAIVRALTTHPVLGAVVYVASTAAVAQGGAPAGAQDAIDHWPLLSLVWSGFIGAIITAVGVVKYYKGAMEEVDSRVKKGVTDALADHIKDETKQLGDIMIELRMHREQFRLLARHLNAGKGASDPGVPTVDLKAEDR